MSGKCPITVSAMCRAGLRGRIFQTALTHGRGRSLELQTIPDLTYSGGYTRFFYEDWINGY